MRITCDVHSDESICVWSSFPKCVERSKFEEVQLFVQLRLFRGVFARVRGIWHIVKYPHTYHLYIYTDTVYEWHWNREIWNFTRKSDIPICTEYYFILFQACIRRVKLMDNWRIKSKDGSLVLFVKN